MYELAYCRLLLHVGILLLVLIAFYCVHVQGNGYSADHFHQTQHCVCFSSQVNMATVDIVALSKSPAKLQISNRLLPLELIGVNTLLFKLTPSRTRGIKTPNFPLQNHTWCITCLDKNNIVTICSPIVSTFLCFVEPVM